MSARSSWRPDISRLRKQLDDAADRTVLIDQYGHAWQKSGYLGTWYRAFDADGKDAHFLMQNAGKSTFIPVCPHFLPPKQCLECRKEVEA